MVVASGIQEMKTGAKVNRSLLVLYACEMICLGLTFLIRPLPFPIAAVYEVIILVVPYAVYRDAAKINKQAGARVISAPLWAILTFPFFFVAVPVYLLIPRTRALSRESVPRIMPEENRAGQVRPPIGFGTIFLGFIGISGLVLGLYDVIYPPNISLGPTDANYQMPAIYVGIIIMGMGALFLVIATILYTRRRTLSASRS
jgi:hypothetical protein